jgi:hypothetical protein
VYPLPSPKSSSAMLRSLPLGNLRFNLFHLQVFACF